MYQAYQAYEMECKRSNIEPLSYDEWFALDDLVD